MIMITVAMLLGLILCLLFGVPYVDIVKKKMFNQHIKDVVAEQHKAKDGTPTTGGIFIFAAIVIASVTTLMLAQKLTTTALIIATMAQIAAQIYTDFADIVFLNSYFNNPFIFYPTLFMK